MLIAMHGNKQKHAISSISSSHNLSLSLSLSLSLPPMKSLQDLRFIPKPSPFIQTRTTYLPISLSNPFSTPKSHQYPVSTQKTPSLSLSSSFSEISAIHLPNSPNIDVPTQKIPSFFNFTATHLKKLALLTSLSSPLPSFAAETEQAFDRINIESILVSIDDFFNRYPFFVAGCAFIWLVVIPLTEEYLKKYKFISAIDAFRKLRDLSNSELLDIRKKQSVNYLNSPNLKVLNKSVAQVEFVEGEEEVFVKEVLKRFGDPGSTVLCVLDNFDGNSLKVAELLFKSGFKEVYAIKGGLRGKDGWQAIQETLLPPSVHVYPRKKKSKSSSQLKKTRERINEKNSGNGQLPSSSSIKQEHNQDSEKGCSKPAETSPEAILANGIPLSPYPKYPDLKPPSSPTPSKPQS